jgi:hypothetical protein
LLYLLGFHLVASALRLSAVAMRRLRRLAVIVTAVAIGRAFVARVGFALIRAILLPCFRFA